MNEIKMGWFSSSEEKTVENNGLLNGNFINNGNFVRSIDDEVHQIEKLFIVIIVLLFLILVSIVVKSFVKFIRKAAEQERRIETIALRNPQV